MPGDATHVRSAKYGAVIGAVILYTAGIDILHIIATVVLFMFCAMFLSPDLDFPDTKPLQRWGKLRWCWFIFEKRIKHRSRWSHGWILGWLMIQLNFLLIVAVMVTFLRLCWLPLIEPMIAQANLVIDDLLRLHLSKEFIAVGTWYILVSITPHWHHKIMDILVRN